MCSGSDSDERDRDVVHDYVGCLPDDAAAGLDIGGASGGLSEDSQRIGAFLFSRCCRSAGCGEVLAQ